VFVGSGADRYDYDANGNVTIRNKGLSTQQGLTWSDENRLVSVTDMATLSNTMIRVGIFQKTNWLSGMARIGKTCSPLNGRNCF
jgi:hypothetical protein